MKRGEYVPPGVDDFDLFHRAIAVIKSLLQGERPDASPAEINAALRAVPGRKETVPSGFPEDRPAGTGPASGGENHAPEMPGPYNGSEQGTDRGGMVRIAAHKLDRLTAGAESLLTTRLFITQRIRELEEMATRFSLWQWNYSQAFNDLQAIRGRASGKRRWRFLPIFSCRSSERSSSRSTTASS